MILTSSRIIKKVSRKTGLPERVVRLVWNKAVEVMKEEIRGQGEVRITGFLHLTPHVLRARTPTTSEQGVPTIRVSARTSRKFREELRTIIIPDGS